LSLFK